MSEPRTNYSILLVDDDLRFHKDFHMNFRRHYEIDGAADGKEMWEKLKSGKFDLLLLDLMLDGKDTETGMILIKQLAEKNGEIPIIAITADDKIRTAVKAIKEGAKNFLQKNDEDYVYWDKQFQEVIKNSKAPKKIQQLEEKVRKLEQGEANDRYPFIGNSPRILQLKNMLEILAKRPNVTLLITGETGTGKEVAARYLHSCGLRREKPFVAVNLSAIPKTLLESALFGSVKGAFTDAKSDVEGYFKQANGGILLLDEIGDIDQEIQVKLLRFLQERTIRPVGATRDIELDVQIIAATHKNLDVEVQKGNFREDLRFRINVTVDIPPLRDRREDILPIVEYYLETKYPEDGLNVIEPEVVRRIQDYSWPGNIRQLFSLIDGLILWRELYDCEKADMRCFEEAMRQTPSSAGENGSPALGASLTLSVQSNGNSRDRKKAQIEDDLRRIETTLQQMHFNKTDTANTLGYKNIDVLRARIQTCYKNFPELFVYFPLIKDHYASALEIVEAKKKNGNR
jgi:DNA-binding NtrC family response regulator